MNQITQPVMPTPPQQMPKYLCHKEVRALKIAGVGRTQSRYTLSFEGGGDLEVDATWIDRFGPKRGDYFVVYSAGTPDQYCSVSPSKAFEEGYTLQE